MQTGISNHKEGRTTKRMWYAVAFECRFDEAFTLLEQSIRVAYAEEETGMWNQDSAPLLAPLVQHFDSFFASFLLHRSSHTFKAVKQDLLCKLKFVD